MIKAKAADRKDHIYLSSQVKLAEIQSECQQTNSPETCADPESPENSKKIIENYNNNRKKKYLQGNSNCRTRINWRQKSRQIFQLEKIQKQSD